MFLLQGSKLILSAVLIALRKRMNGLECKIQRNYKLCADKYSCLLLSKLKTVGSLTNNNTFKLCLGGLMVKSS